MLLFFDRNALKVVKTTRVWCLADRLTVVDYRGFDYRGFELSTSELVRGGYETLSLLVFRNLFFVAFREHFSKDVCFRCGPFQKVRLWVFCTGTILFAEVSFRTFFCAC